MKNQNVMWLLVIALLIVGAMAYGIIPNYLHPGTTIPATSGTSFPANPTVGQYFFRTDLSQQYIYSASGWQTTTAPPPSGGTTHPAAPLQLIVADYITSSGVVTTTTVDACLGSNGVFDLLSQSDTLTYATTPDTMNVYYPDGAQLILHVDSTADPTGGLDYYSGWYYVTLHDGNSIYKIGENQLTPVSGSPHFTYTVSTSGAATTGSVVAFTSGTTNYWDIGKIFVYPRVNASNINLYTHYSGTTLSSVTDGSTWITTSSTANATLAGDTEHISLDLTFDVANVGWGWSCEGVSTQGQFVTYKPVVIFTTNMTAIDTGQLSSEGWLPINDNTLYAEKAYYKVLSPMYTTKGSIVPQQSIQVPTYCAAATAAKYIFKFWLIDVQLPSSVAIGSSTTTMPTAYGMMTAYGLSAMIEAKAYSASSGVGSGQAITCWATKS